MAQKLILKQMFGLESIHFFVEDGTLQIHVEARAVACSAILNQFSVIGVHRTDLFIFCWSGDLNTGCTYE